MTPQASTDLSGKTVLITGATLGIGLEASVSLAKAGARLVMVGPPDPAQTASARAYVERRSGSETVEMMVCDLSSQAAIRRLAADYRSRHDRLHILINNAGAVFAKRSLSVDGIESTFAVNHLAGFLLTHLLLDLLVASAPAKIVNTASTAHYSATLDFDDLGYERGYTIMKAYRRSKLGNVMFTRKLAKDLAGKGVTVNALHPGAVATNIWSGAPALARPFLAVAKRFMLTPEQGSRAITHLVMSPEVEGKTGLYFQNNRPTVTSQLAQNDACAERLWAESMRLVKLVEGGRGFHSPVCD